MSKEISSKITVIIPAYNSKNTINRCLNSIQNQSYKNLEIIVVNDGSEDRTEDIVKQIALTDDRVKLLSIPNGGVSHARNVGIDNATGDFITFVDSDDTIESNMYEYLLSLIDKYNVQIAHCSYNNYVNDKFDSAVGNNGQVIVMNHDEALSNLLNGKYFAGGMCNKLFYAKLFGSIRLDEKIKINEDVLANFELFDKVEKSVYTDKALYNYYQINTSSSHNTDPIRIGEESLYVAKKILQMSKSKLYEDDAKNRVANISLALYQSYLKARNKEIRDKILNLKREIIENYKNNYCFRRNNKIKYYLLRYIPHLYIGMYKLYDKIRKPKLDPEQ